jgi:lysozyme
MEYSQSGESITKQFESCSLTAYQDIKGVWTIGWGHTGPEVIEGLVWTQAQADAQLLVDIRWASDCVNQSITVSLTQPEFDALVDLCFNIGCDNFSGSTLVRLLNRGDYAEAANQFDLWDHAGGQVVAGLLRRRQAETNEFQGV